MGDRITLNCQQQQIFRLLTHIVFITLSLQTKWYKVVMVLWTLMPHGSVKTSTYFVFTVEFKGKESDGDSGRRETDCHFESDCRIRNMSLLEEVESNA